MGQDLPFEEYIDLMRNIIIETRLDLFDENANKVIIANSPFSWELKPHQKKGILLVHGLFDSPYYMRDVGERFANMGFLVRSILLPGHGTVPGDLLRIDYREWVKAVRYGINSLQGKVTHLYLAGYSLGGLLALNEVLSNNQNYAGLLLFAPAIKPRNRLKFFLARRYQLFSWLGQKANWHQINNTNNYAKYSCQAYNAGFQACLIIEEVRKKLVNKKVQMPMMVILSADDETICDKAIIDFFYRQNNLKNRLLVYTNYQKNWPDQRVILKKSHYPKQRIINFSHICLTISPKNPLLGENNPSLDLSHYGDVNKISNDDIYQGAITKSTLKKNKMARLSYNPDFDNMLDQIEIFISSTS